MDQLDGIVSWESVIVASVPSDWNGLAPGQIQITEQGLIHYNLEGVRRPPEIDTKRLVAEVEAEYDDAPPASFAGRFLSREVDLVDLIRKGIPEREYHACSDGMLICGKRHQWFAPAKEGKSLVALVHVFRMAVAGERIIIIDKENGSDEYARRLKDISESTQTDLAELGSRLRYFDFPTIQKSDGKFLVQEFADTDLIVFDSQRTILTDLGLKEDKSDDFAEFVTSLLIPLSQVGISTLVLDNTGHADTTHSRGSSAKGDLFEVIFSVRQIKSFDMFTQGTVKLDVELTRFGNRGVWTMEIGNGVFGEWNTVSGKVLTASSAMSDEERVMAAMPAIGKGALSGAKVEERLSGQGIGSRRIRSALDTLVKEGKLSEKGTGRRHQYARASTPSDNGTGP